ncbi:hypothetical protein [Jeotgalicoccus sp. S0W5]|uniref:hypothetical protein n=1 Tax=Jeotgalicoccus sp. S0W5 TaxID=2527874 RepID=UPI00141529E4|nr:hypothetical protein [Jeotgalicoccus sp. S0W5]
MAFIFGSVWDRRNRNALNELSKSVERQGISIQDLVANGQLTPAQYATLIQTVNGLLKSGEVGYYDLNNSLRSNVDSIADKIKKGQVTADDFNKNGRLLDSTFFTSDFLAQLNNGTIEATNLLDDSVENRHLVNGAVDYENISDDGVEGLNFESAIREFYGVNKNLILNPTGELHLTTYASQVEDIYYHSLQSSSSPSGSLTNDKKIVLAPQTGYFFYRLKVVGELLNKRVVSFIVQNSNPEATIGIRFLDSSFTQIGGAIYPSRKDFGIYGIENITVPSNANVIEFRADNRGGSLSATITNPIVMASPRINLRDGYINELEQHLEKVEADLEKYKIDDADKLPPIKVKTPNNFSLKNTEISDRIYYDGKDTFMTDYDVSESKRNLGTTYYVDFENGVNSADGLTPQTPFKTYAQAITRADVGEIKLKGGNHYRYNAALPAVNKNINISSYDGVARLIATNKPSWVKTSGYKNVYQTEQKNTQKVVDLRIPDGDGYLTYELVNSISEVNNTTNSFYVIDNTTYIHAKEQPDNNDVLPLISNQNILTTNDITYLYLENIEVIGGQRPVRTVANGIRFYAKNCKFLHGLQVNANGLEIVGGVSSVCQNVIAAKNPMDGFNYHMGTGGSKPYMNEIGCKGIDNGELKGTGGSRSDNGSTLHDGLKGIRLNGYYGYNDGGNIADVNAGTESWNLNCIAFDSYQGYDIIVNGGAKIFLDNVSTIGSAKSIISQSVDDEVYIRRGEFGNKEIAGTEISY